MQSLPDCLVDVAGRAGEPGGKRERVGFGRDDRLVELVLERDEMDGCRPVPVPLLLLAACGVEEKTKQGTGRGQGAPRPQNPKRAWGFRHRSPHAEA